MSATSFERKTLAEVASRDRFAIVDGPFGTQLHASEYTLEGVPVIRVVNTSFEGRFLTDNLVYIADRKAKQLERSVVRPGDIIVAKTGATIGKSAIFPTDWPRGIIASSCIKITVDKSAADNRFVGYLIQSAEGQRKIVDGAGGSTRTTINTKPFGAIAFRFPPKPEQTKIAEVLSAADQAIEQTEALIAKKERIRAGMMEDLLTRGVDQHGRLRSEETHQFKDSPVGRIPVEWKIQRLNDCVRPDAPICYGILMPGRGHDGGVPVVKVKDIIGGRIAQGDLLLTDPRIDALYKRSRLREGDLLLTIRGTTGRLAVVPPELDGANITQDTARLRLKEEMSTQFFYFLLQSFRVQHQIQLNTLGQAVKGINIAEVKKLFFGLPDENEQNEIARNLGAIQELLDTLRREKAKHVALKTALMQDLLLGRVCVTSLLTGVLEPHI